MGKLIDAEKKWVEKRVGGGGVRGRIIPHQDFVVCLGFENPIPLYTTHARSIHLPYEKINICIQQNSLILVLNPYRKATGPI